MRRVLPALVIVLGILAAACGDDDTAPDAPVGSGDGSAPAAPGVTPTTPGDTPPSSAEPVTLVASSVDQVVPDAPPEDVAAVAACDADLGFGLLRLVGEGENTFLSPYSVATAVAMLGAGANGTTEAEIAAALGAGDLSVGGPDPEAYHAARNVIEHGLAEPGTPVEGDAAAFTLRPANTIFGQDGFSIEEDYLDLLAAYYGAGLDVVDFEADPDGARQGINGWVEDRTEDRIVDLIPPGVIDAATRLVLVNAIYFKASWTTPFDPARTTDQPFNRLGGDAVDVATMHGTIGAGYTDGDGFQAVRLPYEGGTTSMLVVERILFVQDAVHQAFVKVDEEGTEAAAATAISVGETAMPEGATLTVDRPFLFAVVHDPTGEVVFLGQVTDPSVPA